MRVPIAPHSQQHCSVVCGLDFGHSNMCVMGLHCRLHLHFPDVVRCGGSFHMHNCYLYFFFGEMFVNVIFCFLIITEF